MILHLLFTGFYKRNEHWYLLLISFVVFSDKFLKISFFWSSLPAAMMIRLPRIAEENKGPGNGPVPNASKSAPADSIVLAKPPYSYVAKPRNW